MQKNTIRSKFLQNNAHCLQGIRSQRSITSAQHQYYHMNHNYSLEIIYMLCLCTYPSELCLLLRACSLLLALSSAQSQGNQPQYKDGGMQSFIYKNKVKFQGLIKYLKRPQMELIKYLQQQSIKARNGLHVRSSRAMDCTVIWSDHYSNT
jgi:hypothetical protein